MQAFILLICILCGAVSGILYDVLYVARVIVCGVDKRSYTVKDKIFTFFCDLIYVDYSKYDPSTRRPEPGSEFLNLVYSPYRDFPELFHK